MKRRHARRGSVPIPHLLPLAQLPLLRLLLLDPPLVQLAVRRDDGAVGHRAPEGAPLLLVRYPLQLHSLHRLPAKDRVSNTKLHYQRFSARHAIPPRGCRSSGRTTPPAAPPSQPSRGPPAYR